MNGIINFPAIYKDGSLLSEVCYVKVRCKDVAIIGVEKKPAWDSVRFTQVNVSGFFISFDGVEYGTLDMTKDEYVSLCNDSCCSDFRIYEDQYSTEYE